MGEPPEPGPDRVRLNVRDGFLSVQRAKDVYGVVIIQRDKDNPETTEVDNEATEKLRRSMKAVRG